MSSKSRSAVTGSAAVLLAILIVCPAWAQAGADDGLGVMREVDRRGRGFGDLEATLRMTIYDDDDVRTRLLEVSLLEAEDGDHTLAVLREPADLAGTAFLSVRSDGGERSQWIYLPSRRRARRIGGSQSSDSFLGSDFTYADLDPPSLAGYTFRTLREEEIDGTPGVVIERTPAAGPAGARELLWVDTVGYRVHRMEYMAEDGTPARVLLVEEYEVVGGFARPTRLEMKQVGSDARTVLEWSDLRIGVGLTEREFDPRRLGG